MIKLGRVSKETRGQPVTGYIEDLGSCAKGQNYRRPAQCPPEQ